MADGDTMERALEIVLSGNQFKKLYETEITSLREKYGLRKIDVEILYFLHASGEKNTSTDLRDMHLFTKGHISQSIDRMQQLDFIELQPDAEDRRRMHILLTENALQVVGQIASIRREMYDIIFQGVTAEEKQVLLQVVEKISENLEKALS